ncbi:MAG: DUF6511 domain-containing protein [Betaproteobacteria bacterium]|nr:DUF6511 domain-containing protein [Betaproteobacteria bacterium]
MKCWICSREARGFGITDTRYSIADPRRYPVDWVFCSKRCQDAFHRFYHLRINAEDKGKERPMIDATEYEQAAIRRCLKSFGEAAGEIGFDKPLGQYSESEALKVCDAIVTCFTDVMAKQHASTAFPAVRGLPNVVQNPFADLESDLPWDKSHSQKGGA